MEDKNLKAIRLLQIAERLELIIADLKVEINAPIRKRKPSQKMIDKAAAIERIEIWATNLQKKNASK